MASMSAGTVTTWGPSSAWVSANMRVIVIVRLRVRDSQRMPSHQAGNRISAGKQQRSGMLARRPDLVRAAGSPQFVGGSACRACTFDDDPAADRRRPLRAFEATSGSLPSVPSDRTFEVRLAAAGSCAREAHAAA